MLKCARHQPGLYSTLLNDVCHSGFNLKYRPKVKPTVMGVYESQHILAKWVQGGRAVYFIQWQNYSQVKVRETQLSTCPKNSSLPSRTIFRFILCWWMLKETSSSICDGFKIASGMKWNYHDVARCSASTFSWFAVRPPWASVPCHWRRTDSSRP